MLAVQLAHFAGYRDSRYMFRSNRALDKVNTTIIQAADLARRKIIGASMQSRPRYLVDAQDVPQVYRRDRMNNSPSLVADRLREIMLPGTKQSLRTFRVVGQGDTEFVLAIELAQFGGYKDSRQMFCYSQLLKKNQNDNRANTGPMTAKHRPCFDASPLTVHCGFAKCITTSSQRLY